MIKYFVSTGAKCGPSALVIRCIGGSKDEMELACKGLNEHDRIQKELADLRVRVVQWEAWANRLPLAVDSTQVAETFAQGEALLKAVTDGRPS